MFAATAASSLAGVCSEVQDFLARAEYRELIAGSYSTIDQIFNSNIEGKVWSSYSRSHPNTVKNRPTLKPLQLFNHHSK
jgi:hypothetical protein